MSEQVRSVVDKREKRGTHCRPSKELVKTPKTVSEMSASEKRKRIAQKKVWSTSGKPRRVESARRRKTNDPTTKKMAMKKNGGKIAMKSKMYCHEE